VFVHDVIAAIKTAPSGITSFEISIFLAIPLSSRADTGRSLCGWDGPANVLVTVVKSNLIVLAYVASDKVSAHSQ
jgi:hypothetical protein